MTWMEQTLAVGQSQGGMRVTLSTSSEATATLGGLYEYALGRAPSSAELAAAQAGLGGGGSLRGVYDGLIGPAAAGLLGDAGEYDEALRQVRLPGGGTGGSGSAAGRALQGALAWAGRVGPSLVGRGAAGVTLFVPFNAGQQVLEVEVEPGPRRGLEGGSHAGVRAHLAASPEAADAGVMSGAHDGHTVGRIPGTQHDIRSGHDSEHESVRASGRGRRFAPRGTSAICERPSRGSRLPGCRARSKRASPRPNKGLPRCAPSWTNSTTRCTTC